MTLENTRKRYEMYVKQGRKGRARVALNRLKLYGETTDTPAKTPKTAKKKE